MGSRKDWDSLFQGLAGGFQTGFKMAQNRKAETPASPEMPDLSPDAMGKIVTDQQQASMKQTAGNAFDATLAAQAPAFASAAGLPTQGMSQQQIFDNAAIPMEALQQHLPQGGISIPGLADGGSVEAPPEQVGPPSPQPAPAQPVAPIDMQGSRQVGKHMPQPDQMGLPQEAGPIARPIEVMTGVSQEQKDAWDNYRQEYRNWLVEGRRVAEWNDGTAGAIAFEEAAMEQNRRKTAAYMHHGVTALAKGDNASAAALINKANLMQPVDLGVTFMPDPTNKENVIAVGQDGEATVYNAEDAFSLMAGALSSSDDYVSYLNSQQGYEIDKQNAELRGKEFEDNKAYRGGKMALDQLDLMLRSDIHKQKLASGAYGDDPKAFNGLYKKAEDYFTLLDAGEMEGGSASQLVGLLNGMEDGYQLFMNDLMSNASIYPHLYPEQLIDLTANRFLIGSSDVGTEQE